MPGHTKEWMHNLRPRHEIIKAGRIFFPRSPWKPSVSRKLGNSNAGDSFWNTAFLWLGKYLAADPDLFATRNILKKLSRGKNCYEVMRKGECVWVVSLLRWGWKWSKDNDGQCSWRAKAGKWSKRIAYIQIDR